MPAVIREDQIGATVDLLVDYVEAGKPIQVGDVAISPEEVELVRSARLARAKLALENAGIKIMPPMATCRDAPADSNG